MGYWPICGLSFGWFGGRLRVLLTDVLSFDAERVFGVPGW